MKRKVSIPVLCISGPTASGKSNLGIDLALEMNGEIINADSMQVYRGFDIGSGKITNEQMRGVPHHLLSHVSPEEQYSAGRFRNEAFNCIVEIHSRDKIPILVGGTGLYLTALFGEFINSWGLNTGDQFLQRLEETSSIVDLPLFYHSLLHILDLKSASRIPLQDEIRTRRALQIVLSSGLPVDVFKSIRNVSASRSLSFDNSDLEIELIPLVWILDPVRESLYQKIDARVIQMFEQNWISEVLTLLKDFSPSCPAFSAIGYRDVSTLNHSGYCFESKDFSSLIEKIQRDTRRFAKRQLTWWRNQPESLDWIPLMSSLYSDESSIQFPTSQMAKLFSTHVSVARSSDLTEEESRSGRFESNTFVGSYEYCKNALKVVSDYFVYRCLGSSDIRYQSNNPFLIEPSDYVFKGGDHNVSKVFFTRCRILD